MPMEEKLISKKKPFYPIIEELRKYLKHHSRWVYTPVYYDDLLRFSGSVVVFDENDHDTLWVRVYYSDSERVEIDFYVKKTDASRVYGLEFEHMLSPHNLNFLVNDSTLIEEHIAGIPGDVFIEKYLDDCTAAEQAQIAKEYVKFNERSMIRLLGDMRAYNYVVIPIHDFDKVIYQIRAIDFDQQSFEGKLMVYRPQFFKENYPMISVVKKKLSTDSIIQYKIEERSILAKRILSAGKRLNKLMKIMNVDRVSKPENIENLSKELYKFTKDDAFKTCTRMGEVMHASFSFVLRNYKNMNLSNLMNP